KAREPHPALDNDGADQLRVVSWNIRAGGGVRAMAIAEQLQRWSPDVAGLCEFRATAPSRAIADALAASGLQHQLSSASPEFPSRNSLLLASRWPLSAVRLRQAPLEPGRWLAVRVGAPEPFVL